MLMKKEESGVQNLENHADLLLERSPKKLSIYIHSGFGDLFCFDLQEKNSIEAFRKSLQKETRNFQPNYEDC